MRVAFHYQLLTNDYQLRITHCVMRPEPSVSVLRLAPIIFGAESLSE